MKRWDELTTEEKFARHAQGEEILFWWLLLLTVCVVVFFVLWLRA